MGHRISWWSAIVALAAATGGVVGACSATRDSVDENLDSGTTTDARVDTGTFDVEGDSGLPPPTGPFDDFPKDPILEPGAPKDAAALFGPAGTGASGGPCLVEPEIGALMPRNWLRPRFRSVAPSGQNLFELRLHAKDELSDLVVYSTSPSWTMPKETWDKLTTHLLDQPITVTVRGATYDAGTGKLTSGPSMGSSGTFTIAPATADGTIVYWMLEGTVPGVSVLKGFSVGQETVTEALRPAQIGAVCIGCHSSTPDGKYVALDASDDPSTGAPTRTEIRDLTDPTKTPPFLTTSAKNLLARKNQHGPTFSKSHWTAGDRMVLNVFPDSSGKFQLMWTDLEAKSETLGVGYGTLVRSGDTGSPGAPAFSHDGKTVAYFSTPGIESGMIAGDGSAEIWTVPWSARAGGVATALVKDATSSNWMPTFSPDDKLIAFNRSVRGKRSVDVPEDEVFVVPVAGGAPTRLSANDPPACTGAKSPGVTNSWPKWAPQAATIGTKTYYWITFSSKRGDGKTPQLYVSAVVVEGTSVTTYPALYLWNQPPTEHNHTPAWDVFALPGPK